VREITHLLESSISKDVRIHLDFPDDLPAVDADVAQLQQVIMNVILNGAESIDVHGGDVHVKAAVTELTGGDLGRLLSLSAREGPHVMIETRDTGHGIDDAALGRIFDPFYTTKGPGRGLGLAAVIGIMHSHRGALSVTSTPGGGTTVRLYFPVATNRPAEATPARTVESSVHGTVLVIDDERTVRAALARVLTSCGYEAVVADSGRQGLAIFKARLAGIRGVILDLTMPDMSGGQTFRELRRMRHDLPVLLVSGSDHSDELPEILRHERVRLLTKPFTSEVLLEELAEALQ
jgi:CheY-like chemotaxis protein